MASNVMVSLTAKFGALRSKAMLIIVGGGCKRKINGVSPTMFKVSFHLSQNQNEGVGRRLKDKAASTVVNVIVNSI